MIRVRGLVKRYGRVKALDGLDLSVPEGAIYGFIGQNGAGKTTTIRILATLLLPDGGEVEVAGCDALRRPAAARRAIGYVPDFFGVYDDLKVMEYLLFYAAAYGIRGPAARRLAGDLLELVDLADKRDEYVEGLSRGMQQRLCLARALIHDPQVLLLDEPASGLDPVARVEFRELLKELAQMGKTILISSHILAELAEMCTHVGIIAQGRMLFEGTVGELLGAVQRGTYALEVLRDAQVAAAAVAAVPGVEGVEVVGGTVRFRCPGPEAAAAALAAAVAAGVPVIRFGREESTMEEAFVRLARGLALAPAGGEGA